MKKWIVIPALVGTTLIGGTVISMNTDFLATADNNTILAVDEVKKIALKEVSGKVTSIELDDDWNRKVYEIEVLTADFDYDLKFDAITGELLKTEKENLVSGTPQTAAQQETTKSNDDDKLVNQLKASTTSFISQDKAISIALQKAKGDVTKVELDEDDGQYVYEIETHDGTYEYEIEINAVTGAIIEFEKDGDDD